MEKPSASASENWQKIIAIEAACNCDAVEYEGQRSSSRMNGSAEVISKFSSLNETGTEIENGESSSGIPSMSKESYQFESDDDVIELEAVPITKIRFKQLVQQDVPAKMRADFHRKRRAKRKSYGIPPKKLKPNIKQEPKEGCCVYCFSDEESDLKCGKLLKQHGIIIHQHCMVYYDNFYTILMEYFGYRGNTNIGEASVLFRFRPTYALKLVFQEKSAYAKRVGI